ncbi:IclR family transcriptional regulator [Pararobbsia alpina]|uniref:Transcriptional regulator KdgR n=1 Tax=Pararobbsia alpina TaxID=621374 RepID=A0A6S7BIP0_9BURK|nr:IclR family transcriptional regulator [Pararobbsia alpina]CAB3792486.1 Transcriptional regulator KdgR [Pararobbsia alpina]
MSKSSATPPLQAADSDEERPKYSVPALEKGLDILELLATQSEGLTQSAIAAELDRSTNEIFRMLNCLERRGWISRRRPEETYTLSLKLFHLANHHPPARRLLDVAIPQMRQMALSIQQSCHLGVYSDGALLVIAQVESPIPVGLSVRQGVRFPLIETSSGRVLLAFQRAEVQEQWLREAGAPQPGTLAHSKLMQRLLHCRHEAFETVSDETLDGVTDICFPVFDPVGEACAALAVPFLAAHKTGITLAEVCEQVALHAATITEAIGGFSPVQYTTSNGS